jgi:hypothetical protein
MKTSSLTQTIKEFLIETMFSSKKAKDALIKEKRAKSRTDEKNDLNKNHPYPIPEDKKFRNVTE